MRRIIFLTLFFVAWCRLGFAVATKCEEVTFKNELKKYIDALIPSAKKALSAKSWGLGFLVDYGSAYSKKGNSVDTNELKLFAAYTDADYREAIASLSYDEIKKLSEKAYDEIKNETDENKWHDQLYEIINEHNSELLFQEKRLSRPEAMKKMLDNKDNSSIKKQFVFGIAVTKTVEELMSKK